MSRTRPKHAPRVPFALLVTGIVVGGLCLFLVLNTASAANELDRHDLAGKDASISAQLEQLRNEVAASAAPDALARAAARLGMVPAGDPAFLVIGADGKVRVLGSAAAATAPATPHPHTKSTSSKSESPKSSSSKSESSKSSSSKSESAKSSSSKSSSKSASTSASNSAPHSRSATKSTSPSTTAARSRAATTPTTPLGGGAR